MSQLNLHISQICLQSVQHASVSILRASIRIRKTNLRNKATEGQDGRTMNVNLTNPVGAGQCQGSETGWLDKISHITQESVCVRTHVSCPHTQQKQDKQH